MSQEAVFDQGGLTPHGPRTHVRRGDFSYNDFLYAKTTYFMIPPPPFLQFMIRARIWALLGEPDLEAKGWGCNFLVLRQKRGISPL